MGSGAVLGLAPAPEYTFLIYVSPVGNYFKVVFFLYWGFWYSVINSVSASDKISLHLVSSYCFTLIFEYTGPLFRISCVKSTIKFLLLN